MLLGSFKQYMRNRKETGEEIDEDTKSKTLRRYTFYLSTNACRNHANSSIQEATKKPLRGGNGPVQPIIPGYSTLQLTQPSKWKRL